MGDDQDPEAEGEAPKTGELTWACISSEEFPVVFYADRDVTKPGVTQCVRLDRLELSAKAIYYVVKSLEVLRGRTKEIFEPGQGP